MADKKLNNSKKTKSVKKQKSVLSTGKIVLFSIFASALLLVTNSAYWINNQIFNTTNFTNTATTALTSETSRTAMAERITDRIFADKLIAKRVAGNFSEKIISGILDTDQFKGVLNSAVTRLQSYSTSSSQKDIEIDLSSVKDVIAKVTNASESLGREVTINSDNIPDSITIMEEEKIPDLYKIGIVFLWLSPVTFILSLLLFVYPHIKYKNDTKTLIILQGIILTIMSLFGLLLGPLFKPPALSGISEPSGKIIAGNLYDGFIGTFNSQTLMLVSIGTTIISASMLWFLYPTIKNIINTRKQ